MRDGVAPLAVLLVLPEHEVNGMAEHLTHHVEWLIYGKAVMMCILGVQTVVTRRVDADRSDAAA